MKAVVWTKYGTPNGLRLQEVEAPVPKDNEVMIKIHAATASITLLHRKIQLTYSIRIILA